MKLSEMIAIGKNNASNVTVASTVSSQNAAQAEEQKLKEAEQKRIAGNKAILTEGAETLRVASEVNLQVQGVLDGKIPSKNHLPPVPAKGITEATAERVEIEEENEGNEDLDRQLREQHDLDKSLVKSNLVKRLKKLATMGATITFLAETPGTKSGRAAHVAMMKNFEVKKTQDDNYTVTGRDIEEEAKADIAAGVGVLKVEKERTAEDGAKFRSFRIDRIVRGSLNYSF